MVGFAERPIPSPTKKTTMATAKSSKWAAGLRTLGIASSPAQTQRGDPLSRNKYVADTNYSSHAQCHETGRLIVAHFVVRLTPESLFRPQRVAWGCYNVE